MQKLSGIGLPRRTMARVLHYFQIPRKTPEGYGARVFISKLESHSGAFPPENVHAYVSDSSGRVEATLRPRQFEEVLGTRRRAGTLSHYVSLGFRMR